MNPTAPVPVNRLLEKRKQIDQLLKKQATAGARLLGRWFVVVGREQRPELEQRMEDALRKSLKRPRDRRLFGLEPLTGTTRSLSYEVAEAELADVRLKLEQLHKREEQLAREIKVAHRRADDARLILRGEVLKRWRERDKEFATYCAQSLSTYLRHPTEFAAVGLPVPQGWQAPAAVEEEGRDSAEELKEKPPPKMKPEQADPAALKAAGPWASSASSALPPVSALPAPSASASAGGAGAPRPQSGLPAPRIALSTPSGAEPAKAGGGGAS